MINYLRLKLFSNIVLTAILLSVCFSLAAAKDGDTIKVRTVEFGASRDGWFTFPSAGTGFEKVLMNYKLKCPKGSPCGEWDYIAYVFVKQFFKFDTTYPTPANPVITKTRVYYSDSTTVTESTEIMRYITPYGNGLNLGSGYVWVIDVTDFLPFLSDSVYISAPNGQEDLELTFDFILGTPPRNIINFRNMWNKNLTYDSTFEENVAPMDIQFDDNEKMARLKIVQTGHGFGGTVDNCAEFCKKESYILVNKDTLYKKFVWRECGDNFLYPQGGTWLLDRTNWCPGAEVTPYDYELSKYIQPGKTASIDYGMEYYNEKWTSGSNTRPNWVLRSYLITYSDPNFELDASIEDIISPSLKQEYLRLNPICNGAEIIIKNNGNRKLTSLDFEYGIVGGGKAAYHWTGNLDFIQTEKVKLPPF
ncbi:MAG: C-terminal target protein, partial [Bacteroidota bacterium]|nr:C-terminal target protein [Bacteroidota bacterium]